jgi:hypothetical protein
MKEAANSSSIIYLYSLFMRIRKMMFLNRIRGRLSGDVFNISRPDSVCPASKIKES